MNLRGVCFGVGTGWDEAATWAAARMERITGIECSVITDAPGFTGGARHPSWWKCRVWEFVPEDVDALVIFDADVVALEGLTRSELSSALVAQPLVAALDVRSRGVRSECAAYSLDPGLYVNCGFLVVHRKARELLERAWARGPHYGSWMEQTAINVELRNAGWLSAWPRGWQCFVPAVNGPIVWGELDTAGARVVHVTGLGKQLPVLADLHRQIEEAHSTRHSTGSGLAQGDFSQGSKSEGQQP